MNNNFDFDFDSKKYMILLVLICAVFTIFIVKAFDYIPDKEVTEQSSVTDVENINLPAKNTDSQQTNQTINPTEEKQKPVQKSGILYKSSDSLTSENEFEEIDAPQGINESLPTDALEVTTSKESVSSDVKALQSIINARKLYSKGNLTEAIEEYQKAIELSDDNQIKTEALEGISLLYLNNKKYGTALSFAVKAYKLAPSLSNKILIIKIYYSAGKTETAISKLNELVKQGF